MKDRLAGRCSNNGHYHADCKMTRRQILLNRLVLSPLSVYNELKYEIILESKFEFYANSANYRRTWRINLKNFEI